MFIQITKCLTAFIIYLLTPYYMKILRLDTTQYVLALQNRNPLDCKVRDYSRLFLQKKTQYELVCIILEIVVLFLRS